jgi:hypothetical protein
VKPLFLSKGVIKFNAGEQEQYLSLAIVKKINTKGTKDLYAVGKSGGAAKHS